jgi:hypothetical protein
MWIKNNGVGKVGDTIVAEPALTAFAKQEKTKIFYDVDFTKKHEDLFIGHPYIIPVPRVLEVIKPDYEVSHSKAFGISHAKMIPFGAGFFEQLGMNHEGNRVHYNNYYINDPFNPVIIDKFVDSVVIVPNAYSCTSRDSTTGQPSSLHRPNCQPPIAWWEPVLDSLRDHKVFTLSSNSSWDWVRFPEIENVECPTLLYLLKALKSAKLLISVETGTLHLASATKTPTVFLSSATPTVFAKPDTACRVVRSWYADEFRISETIKAIEDLLAKP